MTKQELEIKIRRQAGDLIYCYVQDSFAPYLGKGADIIFDKRNKQIAYLKGLCYAVTDFLDKKALFELVQEWIADEIANTYEPIVNPSTGKLVKASPMSIIYQLMSGQTVKGRDWKQGVYGCKVGSSDLSASKDVIVGGGVPMVTMSGSTTSNLGNYTITQNFDGSVSASQPSSITTVNKQTNTINKWQLNTKTGLYDFATVSDGTTTLDSNGNKLTASNQTLWDNINNCLGQIQALISGFAEFLSGFTAAEAITPVQTTDGWVEAVDTKNESSLLTGSTGLIVGGAVLAGALLLNKKK